MKKNLLFTVLVALLGASMIFAVEAGVAGQVTGNMSEIKGGTSNKTTTLNVSWNFDDAVETYKVGFTSEKPAESLNTALNLATATSTLEIKNSETNSDEHHTGEATFYVYWDLYTRAPFKATLKADGPLKNVDSPNTATWNNLINWTATWQAYQANTSDGTAEAVGKPKVLGVAGSDYAANTFGGGNYSAVAEGYTNELEVYTQADGPSLKAGKKGFTEVKLLTDDTKLSTEGNAKVQGMYRTNLILTISSPA